MGKITYFPALFRYTALVFALFIVATMPSVAQDSSVKYTYRVLFRDKGTEAFLPGSSLYRQTENMHNVRCIERRKKVMPVGRLFSLADAPVYQPYIDSLRKNGAEILLKLRWNNYAVIRCDSIKAEQLASFKFVEKIQRTSSKLQRMSSEYIASPWIISAQERGVSPVIQQQTACGAFRYGPSFNQAAMLGVPELHSMGITGNGSLIGFLDSGFRRKTSTALQNADVTGEYDFIHNDSITSNEDGDSPSQDDHGSFVFSTVAGFTQDSLIGIAPFASFMLAKTEDVSTETHIEEDNYAAAIEWLESSGADIASSSLGYSLFNPSDENYTFEELNGHTTITADIVNKAVERGMICITAAGNAGPQPQTLISPADADSVIAIGGLMADGITPATFSSRGPNGRGITKPDIAAQAVGVVGAIHYQQTGVRIGSGTSFATPIIAGSVGLMLSVFPEITPYELRDALYKSASQADTKDDTLGFGRANIPAAMLRVGTIVSPGYASYPIENYQRFCFYIHSPFPTIQARLVWYASESVSPKFYSLKATAEPYQYIVEVPKSDFGTNGKGRFYLDVSTSGDRRTMPYFKGLEEKTLLCSFGEKTISCGIDEQTLPLAPDITASVEVMPNVIDNSRDNATVTIPVDADTPFVTELYNSAGQRVWYNHTPSPHTDITIHNIPTKVLASGFYFVIVRANGRVMTSVLVRM